MIGIEEVNLINFRNIYQEYNIDEERLAKIKKKLKIYIIIQTLVDKHLQQIIRKIVIKKIERKENVEKMLII